jgi:hypothetical protein
VAGWIVIPNWRRFQHYGDRRDPPWIKNYEALLHNADYLALTGHQRGVLHGLWLEYAASHCQIADSTATVTRQLGVRVSRATLKALNDAGFIEFSASRPLASHALAREVLRTSKEGASSTAPENGRASSSEEDDPEPPRDPDALAKIQALAEQIGRRME